MADQRLNLLMKKTEAEYKIGSPLVLEASALYIDTTTSNCIAQMKWRNIDSRPVKAVMIELITYDAFNQMLESIHYQYDGLLVAQGSEFGSKAPIIIKSNKVVRYSVVLKAVSFSDDTIWRPESDDALVALPAHKDPSITGELLDQLKRDLSVQGNKIAATYEPQSAFGLWQCGCGSWQYVGSPCLKCRISQQSLEELSNETVLSEHLAEYKEEQEKRRIEAEKRAEEARIAREKAEKERREKEEAERRRREEQARIEAEKTARLKAKHKRTAIISIITVIVLLVAGYYAITTIQRKNKYNEAKALVAAGSFDEARTALTELGEYQDCAILVKQVDADQMWATNRYAEAYDIYCTLPAEYQTHAQDYEYNYNLADTAEKQGDYEKASRIFGVLGKYKDSPARHAAAEISRKEALAKSYIDAGKYNEARDVYLDLGYENEATECLYLLAGSQATKQPWLAYNNYLALGNYKDSAAKAKTLYSKRYERMGEKDANGFRTFFDPQSQGYGLLDKNDDVLITPKYSSIVLNKHGAYTVTANNKYGVFNTQGSEIIPTKYDKLEISAIGYNVSLSSKLGILSKDGTTILAPTYDQITVLEDGRYLVCTGSLYGIFDKNGASIIKCQYDRITYENTGTYTVVKNGKYGIVKYDGTIVHEANMELIKAGSNDGRFLLFRKDGLYGFMDASTFAVVVAPEWKSATIMTDGYAYIMNNLDKWGVIDSKGNVIVTPQWTNIKYYEDCGFATRSSDGSRSTYYHYYLMNNRGTLVCDFKDTIEYLGNGVFRNDTGKMIYDATTNKSYSYTVNKRDMEKMRIVGPGLISGYYSVSSGSSWSYSYGYGVINIAQEKIVTNQMWEKEIITLPSRNTVNGKYGWIGADGTDLVNPTYDFMMTRIVNGCIVAGKYNDRGNLVYSLIDPTNGKVLASNLSTREEAFNYFGKPTEDMSTHGQLMWILTNAGFDTNRAESFIRNCTGGYQYSAESDYEKVTVSSEFRSIWSSLKSDIRYDRVKTEELLLEKLISYGLE